jgi:plasmid maintenance system antidote protein VapI
MRMDVKVAILKSGRPQYQIAQAIGVSEYRLSKYVHGRADLRPEQEQKLEETLGLQDERAYPVMAGAQGGR